LAVIERGADEAVMSPRGCQFHRKSFLSYDVIAALNDNLRYHQSQTGSDFFNLS
jgi:hypothetical protein